MHILFATTDFIENNGPTTGLPKYLYRTSLKLIEWGNKVTVVTCSNRTVMYEFFGINVHRIRGYNIKCTGDEYKDEINFCMRNAHIIHDEIAKIIKNEKIDIIQYASLSGIAYFHDFKIPSLVRLSSYAKMWPLVGQENIALARAEMEIQAAHKCNAIICPSNVVASEFSKDIGKDVEVIETPFVLESTNEDLALYNAILKEKKYLLFFGTIIEYKGINVIADAVYDILNKYPDLYLVIIGDGDLSLIDKILKNAKDKSHKVIYHCAVGFEILKPIIKNAYAVLLPSLMENFSNACVEAMAFKKIVIGTNGVSFEQLIEDNINGFLCEPGDVNSFLDAIERLMKLQIDEKSKMEDVAVLRVAELAPERVTMQLMHYYQSVIDAYWR